MKVDNIEDCSIKVDSLDILLNDEYEGKSDLDFTFYSDEGEDTAHCDSLINLSIKADISY
jgi:hypothetical protein